MPLGILCPILPSFPIAEPARLISIHVLSNTPDDNYKTRFSRLSRVRLTTLVWECACPRRCKDLKCGDLSPLLDLSDGVRSGQTKRKDRLFIKSKSFYHAESLSYEESLDSCSRYPQSWAKPQHSKDLECGDLSPLLDLSDGVRSGQTKRNDRLSIKSKVFLSRRVVEL